MKKWKEEFLKAFPDRLESPRTIGREGEFHVVDEFGQAKDLTDFFEHLAKNSDFQASREPDGLLVELKGPDILVSREVGAATIELISKPAQSLFEIKESFEKTMNYLVSQLEEFQLSPIGFGVHPFPLPDTDLMTPKDRYKKLKGVLNDHWDHFTLSASDQTHVSITKEEIIPLTNYLHLITPLILRLTSNSSIINLKDAPALNLREFEKRKIQLEDYRHGTPHRPYEDLSHYLDELANKVFLIRKSAKGDVRIINKRFSDVENELTLSFKDFLDHDHYIWNSARPRAQIGTIEYRPICQQPWADHMTASATVLAFVESKDQVLRLLNERLGDKFDEVLAGDYSLSKIEGLSDQRYTKEFWNELVSILEQSLEKRGFGEQELLNPLKARIKKGENPGETARSILKEQGPQGLLDYLKIRPL